MSHPQEAVVIDVQKHNPYVQDLIMHFVGALKNPAFTGAPVKVEKAKKALEVPDPEERVRKQLTINARKKLAYDAQERMQETGQYVPPTEEEIAAYVEEGIKRWKAKN